MSLLKSDALQPRLHAGPVLRHALSLLAIGGLVMGSGACAMLGKRSFANPVVTIRDVRLVGVGLTGGSLDVVLNVYNPNGYRLDATKLTYRVLVDSTEVAADTIDQRMNVQAGDSTRVTIPVTFTYAGLGTVAQRLRNNGALDYRITGDLTVATPVGTFTRPYDQRGRYTVLGGEQPQGSN